MITKKVETLFLDFHPEHSEFQIENFIIGGQGGTWAQYRQVLRELGGRHEGVKAFRSEIICKKKEIEAERRKWFKDRKKIERLTKEIESAKKSFKPKAREYFTFYKLAVELKRKLGEITPQKRRQLEAEMWVEKAKRMAAIDLISIGGLQRSTVEFVTSFPRELRRQIFSDLRPENRQKLLSTLD
jgi:hypothetical protein